MASSSVAASRSICQSALLLRAPSYRPLLVVDVQCPERALGGGPGTELSPRQRRAGPGARGSNREHEKLRLRQPLAHPFADLALAVPDGRTLRAEDSEYR